jgi:hypothetical protein
MADVIFTGFQSIREANAFAAAIEFVHDSTIAVIEVMPHYVLVEDTCQDGDMERDLTIELETQV